MARKTFSAYGASRVDEKRMPRNQIEHSTKTIMITLALIPMFAAAGYSLVYLLAGGGLGGAILIFIVAKMFGK